MNVKVHMEWSDECGISFIEISPFLERIEARFIDKNYGDSLTQVWILVNALGYDVKQRKRYKKGQNRIEFDVLLDYFLIKNVEMKERKAIIRKQMIEVTEKVFDKYKFEDFDTISFTKDWGNTVNSTAW